MLNDSQVNRVLQKLKRFEEQLGTMLFEKVDTLEMSSYQTKDQLYKIPAKDKFKPINKGDKWGGEEHTYCWLISEYVVPKEYAGKKLYVRPQVGGYEAMLWVNGVPFGTFATKIVQTGHGNHYCDMIAMNPTENEKIDIAMEWYTGHYIKGCMPFETNVRSSFEFTYDTVDICVKNEEIADFYFDLRTLNEMVEVMEDSSFQRADVISDLLKLHEVLYYSPENVSQEVFMNSLKNAKEVIKDTLAAKNPENAPSVGVIGHSHMDTAWLWHIDETIKKCARTFSNEISLMEQYDEYMFMQSSSYHTEMVREHYPELFERIKEKVKEGRYEPNGGAWIECDCNITSGESMIRQFLWGQRYTRKHFGYTSDCFWLPDTFGYSASIPQILKGCEIDYFLTTKIAWNDTNIFPYDTFNWKGLDGTKVLTHFNKTHVWPSPKDINPLVFDSKNRDGIRQKSVSKKKLVSYGFGDGGGGPQFEMIEMARRIENVNGVPKVKHTSVSEFMKTLEKEINNPSEYCGELYLELHRGTLTNQHEIKRNNRVAEILLHDLEYLNVQNAVAENKEATDEKYRKHQNTLLVNQFHDILPGTCIPRAHQESKAEMTSLIADVKELINQAVTTNGDKNNLTVINTTSFNFTSPVYVDYAEGMLVKEYNSQVTEQIDGTKKIVVSGMTVKPYGSEVVTLTQAKDNKESSFTVNGKVIETPFAKVTLDDRSFISSFIDKSADRELCDGGYSLNTLLIAEDVPALWDNWDIDADLDMKYKDSAELLETKVVSNGSVELRIRNIYRISEKSTVDQDMIFYADSPMVKFETTMHWNDDHRFLKAAFDTTIFNDFAREEVQFGYIKRPTTRNNSIDQAKFEVLNHKYTDLSELNYGAAILNDCKYGISVDGGKMRLSLHKGGCNPDYTGDKGDHFCEYAFLPHNCGFSANSVIKPAYELNYKPVVVSGKKEIPSFVSTENENVIVETVKACEDGQRAFIVRLYEADGTYTRTKMHLGAQPKSVATVNMLEEKPEALNPEKIVPLVFRPFEIKTVMVQY